MTQEDKSLLLQDLCARLPYGVYMHHKNYPDAKFWLIAVFGDGKIGVSENGIPLTPTSINECKPYLRPMSSITEEERKSYIHLLKLAKSDRIVLSKEGLGTSGAADIIGYLNAHYLDFRGLIPMGLAIEAPEGMYK